MIIWLKIVIILLKHIWVMYTNNIAKMGSSLNNDFTDNVNSLDNSHISNINSDDNYGPYDKDAYFYVN